MQTCPDGHVERVWYNSCRQQFCPQGAQLPIAQWLERQKARRLSCDPYHVIFTLPRELPPVWLANVGVRSPISVNLRSCQGRLVAIVAQGCAS